MGDDALFTKWAPCPVFLINWTLCKGVGLLSWTKVKGTVDRTG